MKFINAEGQLGSGEWLVSGHAFKYKNAEGTSIEDNQVNVFINEGKVQYMKVYQHKISKPIDVEVSVDMSSYKDAYKTVSVFGSLTIGVIPVTNYMILMEMVYTLLPLK